MTLDAHARIADALQEHLGCSCGDEYEIGDNCDHLAEVVLSMDGMAAEYGIHDLTQQGTADVDMWWTDDPSEGFVARDAARDALENTAEFPHHVLVRRYVTRWETVE